MEKQVIKSRREDKYTLSISDYNIVKSKIIKMGFKKAHSNNFVNNIYYDNSDQSYIENIEGETYRTKYRLRWYDKQKGFVFEIKKKNGKSGFKKKKYLNTINKSDLNKEISQLLPTNYYPVIQNRYFREYFIMNNIRLTIDSMLKFSFPDSKIYKTYPGIIIEVKYPIDIKYNMKLIKTLNLRLVKFSKFAVGIDFLRNYNHP